MKLRDLPNKAFKKLFLGSFKTRKKLRIIGLSQNYFKGRSIIVSLHRYDFDPLLISSVLEKHIYWVYASFLDLVPLFRFLLKRYGFLAAGFEQITGLHSIRQMTQILRDDNVLGIFPEGVAPLLSSDYETREPVFHTSFARLAIKTGTPVYPVIIAPRKWKVSPYPVPVWIRKLFRMPEEILSIKKRMRFLQADIIFGEPIPPPGKEQEKNPKVLAEEFSETVRAALLALDKKYNKEKYHGN